MIKHEIILYVFVLIFEKGSTETELPLGKHKPSLGPIKIYEFEPSPEEFYRNFIRKSQPLLIRSKNPSWLRHFAVWRRKEFLPNAYGDILGRVFKRSVWTKGWPVETRMKFQDFLNQISQFAPYYWDTDIALNSTLLNHIPLPFHISCLTYKKWILSAALLYTNQNASSVFHFDEAENFFFQIAGKKVWLLAEPSSGEQAYATAYDVQDNLSPINPEKVDLKKFPKAADISFYEITTEPGDFLYVPEGWWHQVRSYDPTIISINLWADYLVSETGKADSQNQTEPLESHNVDCGWEKNTLFDLKKQKLEKQFLHEQHKRKSRFLYFGSDEGAFYCVDSWDGSTVWKLLVDGDVGSTAVVSERKGAVFFADEKLTVYALSAENGNQLWSTKLKDGVVSGIRLSDDEKRLFVASLDSHIYAIDTQAGKVQWRQGPLNGELWSTPTVHENSILVCSYNDKSGPNVYLIEEKKGNILWNFTSESSIFASPAVNRLNNHAHITDSGGRLYTLNLKDGALVQDRKIGESCESSPVLDAKREKLYIVCDFGTVMCLDSRNLEKTIWIRSIEEEKDESVMSSPLLSLSSNILFAALGSKLFAINTTNGSTVWTFSAGDVFISSPRMDKSGFIYIGCADNKLYAVDSENGNMIWAKKTLGPIVSSTAMFSSVLDEQTIGALL